MRIRRRVVAATRQLYTS